MDLDTLWIVADRARTKTTPCSQGHLVRPRRRASALLIAGQKALGRRFGGAEFYERVEKDLAFGIMRSHFHHGYPKGAHCCVQCTLGVMPSSL
jgi:hypothetical protein